MSALQSHGQGSSGGHGADSGDVSGAVVLDDFDGALLGVCTGNSVQDSHPDEVANQNDHDGLQEDGQVDGDGAVVSQNGEGTCNEEGQDGDNDLGNQLQKGALPSVGTMVLFCALLAIFAIGAPGVPGGTVMASLGIVTSVLFPESAELAANATGLLLAIFAIQDSFGTACNVTGDGALTLILTGYCEKNNLEEQNNISVEL